MRSPLLHLIDYSVHDAQTNMAIDTRLFRLCEEDPSHGYLRFYGWTRPSLSLGRFEKIDVIDRQRAANDGVEIVRRPTGGRVVLHGDDLTYAVVLPTVDGGSLRDVYTIISNCLVRGLRRLGIDLNLERGRTAKTNLRAKPCFASAARYEITSDGRKLVGSAQRIGKCAVLQHGSIPIGKGYLRIAEYMRCDASARRKLWEDLEKSTCCLEALVGKGLRVEEVARMVLAGFREIFEVVQWKRGCDIVNEFKSIR